MAVHEDLPGVEASVCIDGQPIEEFDTENDEVKDEDHAVKLHQGIWTTTKYVEAQTDKEFSIKLALKDPYIMDCPSLACKVIVDGEFVSAVAWFQIDGELRPSREFVIRGPKTRTTSGTTFKPMRFCKIETSELAPKPLRSSRLAERFSASDEASMQQVKEDIGRLSNVGEILVKIHRQEIGVQVQDPYTCKSSGMATSKVHEKVLKGEAKTHGTS